MQKTVIADIQDVSFPAGTVAGQFQFAIQDTDSNTVASQLSNTPSASFNLNPGTYRAAGVRLDGNAFPLQALVFSAEFTVINADEPVTIGVISAVRVVS